MSINDVPEVREIFGWAAMEEVSTSYTIGKQAESRGERGELLVSNCRLLSAGAGA